MMNTSFRLGGSLVRGFMGRRVACASPSSLLFSSPSLSVCSRSSSLRAIFLLNDNTGTMQKREFTTSLANFDRESRKKALAKAEEGKQSESRVVFVKVLEKGKEAGFSMAFIGCIGFLVFCVGYKGLWNGMLSPNSTLGLFRKASKITKKDSDVQQIFGEPVTTSGEGHRGHLIQEETVAGQDGQLRRAISFNVKGQKENGMAYAQFVQDGWWWKIEHLLVVSSQYKMYLVKDGKETTSG